MTDTPKEKRAGDFIRKVSRTVERWEMDATRTLALVSGGPDSVALLRVLLELKSGVRGLHFDHGLRGRESREDARFVSELCSSLGVPCEIVELDLPEGGNIQERARRERYRVAREISDRERCTSISTGHNSDDVAETVLMNLARGAGLRGLSGIPPSGEGVIRPLIECSRVEILLYLEDLDQPFRTDSTNLTDKYTRNRVRREVMPLLEEMYPGAGSNLVKTASLAARDLTTLESLASEAVEDRGSEVVVTPASLLHPRLLSHALRVAYSRCAPQARPLAYDLVEEISHLLKESDGTRTLDLPAGIVVAIRNGSEAAFYLREDLEPGQDEIVSLATGRYGEWYISLIEAERLDLTDASRPEIAYLDAGKGPYRVRTVREGDTIRPLGLGGAKRVFRAMMDRKVPSDLRSRTPVIVDEADSVAWIFLGESDERYVVGERTRKILRVEVSRA